MNEHSYNEFGRYQKRLCLILFLIAVPSAFGTFQFLVTHRQPPFRCKNGGKNTLHGNESSLVVPTFAQANISYLNGDRNNSQIFQNDSCHSISIDSLPTEHNLTNGDCVYFGLHQSVITEFGIVCDRAWIKPVLVGIFMVGMMIGGQVGGILSDKLGRRKILLVATVWQTVFAVLLSFAWNTTSYGAILFLSALPGAVSAQAGTLMGSEFVNSSKRGFSYFCLALGFSFGYMLLPLTTFWIYNWRWWLRFITLLCIPCLPLVWMMDETPVWLLAANKKDEALAVMQKVYEYNGRNGEVVLEELKRLKKDETEYGSVCSTLKNLATVPALRIRLLIIFIAWLMVNMTYYAIALNNDSLSGNWLLNIFLFGAVELASAIGFAFCSEMVGRRNSYVAMMILTALTLCATPFAALVSGSAGVALSMISKFNVTICFSIIYVYTGEIFPTHIRHTVIALSSAVSRIGGILAPFIIYADEVSDSIAPSIGMSVALLISALTFLHLPKSKDYPLPQTVEDAVAMKSNVGRSCLRRTETATTRLQQMKEVQVVAKI